MLTNKVTHLTKVAESDVHIRPFITNPVRYIHKKFSITMHIPGTKICIIVK